MSKAFYSGKKNVSEPKYCPYSSLQHRFKLRIPLNSYYNLDLAEESCNILSKKQIFAGKRADLMRNVTSSAAKRGVRSEITDHVDKKGCLDSLYQMEPLQNWTTAAQNDDV